MIIAEKIQEFNSVHFNSTELMSIEFNTNILNSINSFQSTQLNSSPSNSIQVNPNELKSTEFSSHTLNSINSLELN